VSQGTVALRERLRGALAEYFDLEADDEGDLFVEQGEVRTWFTFAEVGDDRTSLQVFSVPYGGLDPSTALFRWAATGANRFRFGSLSLFVTDEARVNLNWSYSCVVDGLDEESLRASILPVVYTAAELRREAITLFGRPRD
jgi:hypothetical protein